MNFRWKFSALAVAVALFAAVHTASATPVVLYSTLPAPLPPNLDSWPYAVTSTTEFGREIQLTQSGLLDLTVTAVLSNWAYESQFQAVGTSAGFNVPITFTLYSDIGADVPGPAFASKTVNALIPWRPEPTLGCAPEPGSGHPTYRASDGQCYPGALVPITFAFGLQNLPSQLIFGLSYDAVPYDPAAPVSFLNFAFGPIGDDPKVGSNPEPDAAFLNSSDCSFYADPSLPCGFFRKDQAWTGYSQAVEFSTQVDNPIPEPASLMMLATGLVGLGARIRMRRRKS